MFYRLMDESVSAQAVLEALNGRRPYVARSRFPASLDKNKREKVEELICSSRRESMGTHKQQQQQQQQQQLHPHEQAKVEEAELKLEQPTAEIKNEQQN